MATGIERHSGLVRVESAAGLLGVKVSTLYAWVEQNRVPHVRLGRALRFDVVALDRYVKQHTIETLD